MKKIVLQYLLLFSFASLCYSLPLSTRSRWIVDGPSGARVKLSCANWAGHLDPMLPEGLSKRPVGEIARHLVNMGFNCVRLTWPIHMYTRYANVTVAQSFRNLGLHDALEGIARNNPGLVDLAVVDAQRAVIVELGRWGVMVLLDNHVSRPMWCCSENDGNGFFGDKYFDPKEWLQGLHIVAKRYKHTPTVVAMSLRNELHGPLQNETIWYKYVEKGIRTIHKGNPKLLVVVSGLDYDINFDFLKERPLKINFKNKIVYEFHRYAFTEGQKNMWLSQPLSKACESITQEIHKKAGFLAEGENAAPLFVGEFGIDQRDVDRAESLFLGCFLGFLAEKDLDWGVWALQGSYYTRSGVSEFEESFGMLNKNWSSIRNPEIHQKLQLVQQQLQAPNPMAPSYKILYHLSSGQCIRVDNWEAHASDCLSFGRWNHGGDGHPIRLMGTGLCLSAAGDGIPAIISPNCESRWESVAGDKFRLATKDKHGTYLCLDFDPNQSSRILTNKCACLDEVGGSKNCTQSPETQLFKLISANTW